MKGIELPVNTIVIIGLSLLVLVTISAFFITNAGQQMSSTQASAIFANKCTQYCGYDARQLYQIAAGLQQTDPDFLRACSIKVPDWGGMNIRCLERCPCDIQISNEDFLSDVNRLEDCLQAPVGSDLENCANS